jgi:predicted nucleotidyltransferase
VPKSASSTLRKLLEPYIAMISGDIINEMMTEIRGILSTTDEIISVWGFGSFFRDAAQAKDIDLLAVVDRGDLDLDLVRAVRVGFQSLGFMLGRNVDLTILTYNEFQEKRLLEMESLIPLFDRSVR